MSGDQQLTSDSCTTEAEGEKLAQDHCTQHISGGKKGGAGHKRGREGRERGRERGEGVKMHQKRGSSSISNRGAPLTGHNLHSPLVPSTSLQSLQYLARVGRGLKRFAGHVVKY